MNADMKKINDAYDKLYSKLARQSALLEVFAYDEPSEHTRVLLTFMVEKLHRKITKEVGKYFKGSEVQS